MLAILKAEAKHNLSELNTGFNILIRLCVCVCVCENRETVIIKALSQQLARAFLNEDCAISHTLQLHCNAVYRQLIVSQH